MGWYHFGRVYPKKENVFSQTCRVKTVDDNPYIKQFFRERIAGRCRVPMSR